MESQLVLPAQAIKLALNSDSEFKLAARFWNCNIRFAIGKDLYFMRITDGVVQNFSAGTEGFDPYEIHIGGTEGCWEEMMVDPPKPFYHDWFGASFHHDFEISGDLASAYAYYFAIRRIQIITARCVREARLVA